MKTHILLLSLLCLCTCSVYAQNSSIQPDKACINCATNAPDAKAVLELQSTSKGILIPRMTTSNRTAISLPIPAGLLVFDTTTVSFWFHNGTQWMELDADTAITPSLAEVLAIGQSANSGTIIDLSDPINAQDAATKSYVDNNDAVNDADADATNEIQQLQLNGNTLSLTDDTTTVDLSAFANHWTESNGNVFRDSGKVGIGTINPRGTLDANGNVFATGNLILGGSLAGQIYASDPTKNVLAGGIEVYGNTLIDIRSGTFNVIGNDGRDLRMGAQTDTNFVISTISGDSFPDFNGRNLILGDNAGYHTYGNSQINSINNVFLGSYAGFGDMGTTGNTLIGNNAGQNLLDANYNTMIGAGAGTNAYSVENILIGYKTGFCEVDTFLSAPGFSRSVFIGNEIAIAARDIARSVIIGHHAGRDMRGGGNNVLIGFEAGTGITREDKLSLDNIFIGHQAGKDVFTLGSILVGNNTSVAALTDSTGLGNVIAIGHNVEVGCADCTVIGGEKVGLGVSTPTERLDVNGRVRIRNLPVGMGTRVVADADGNLFLEDFPAPTTSALVEELQKENEVKDRRIEALEARLAKIEAMLETLPTGDSKMNNSSSQQSFTNIIHLTDAKLEQNQPNPFNGTTVVRYVIPHDVKRAELRITDLTGKVIKNVVIQERGKGQTTLDATTLSNGNYQYSLFLDNQLLATRQMVLTKN